MINEAEPTQVTINVSGDDWDTYLKIKSELGKKPKELRLELIGMNRMHPTPLLSIYDLLIQRDRAISLVISVQTNLIDGSLLLVLPADRIEVRPFVWFQIATVEQLSQKLAEEREMWNKPQSEDEPASVFDYRKVLGILNEYLPIAELSKKRHPLHETLQEFGLMGDSVEQKRLEELFRQAA